MDTPSVIDTNTGSKRARYTFGSFENIQKVIVHDIRGLIIRIVYVLGGGQYDITPGAYNP